MLQWMGGSRKKVATSRMSTQKRQKQYFEQRKRRQQNLQMMGSDNCSDSTGISGQNPREHRSLDILNLLNLSTNAQQCNSSFLKGRDDAEDNVSTMPGSISTNQPTLFANMDTTEDSYRFEEARAQLCSQIDTSPKKVVDSAPNQKNAVHGPPSHSKTVTDRHSGLSVIDLLYDDEPNATVEKCLTSEDHVSFSIEGLGKVGTETPVHSPEQQARIPCCYSPLLKDGRKSKFKNFDHVLDDIDLEVDTIVQDIKVSPINASNFPFNKIKQSSAISRDCKHFYDHANNNDSSISDEFFYPTENSKEGIWNAGSSFIDVQFDDEEGFDTSWKKTFQMGSRSPELLKSGAYRIGSFDFEDLPPKKWSSAAAMKEINMSEPPASFSKDQLENDFDFYMPRGARFSRLDGNFNPQNLVPEDVRDNSSLLSDESSSSTAVRGEAIKHSSSRIGREDTRRNCGNAFASLRNKCSTKEEKCRSMPNPSKRKSSHYSNSILLEELGAHNSWQFEERCASVDRSSVDTSFCQDVEANFAVFGSNNKTDPFSVFTAPELHNKTKISASSGGFRKAANLADSPPCSFTSDKFAFGCLTEFPSNAESWPISPSFSPNFQFKGEPQDAAGFLWETSSTDMSVQGSASKGERKVKLQKDRCKNFEQGEDIFMGDNELSSGKKMERHASTSNNYTQECEGTEDTNPKTTECLETADSPGHVDEISSSLNNKADKHESQVDKRKSNCDAETPLKYKITKEEEMKNWKTVSGKRSKEHVSLSGQVMFESCVFQLLCVQKVLKEACTTPRRNNAFLEPGSKAICHQI